MTHVQSPPHLYMQPTSLHGFPSYGAVHLRPGFPSYGEYVRARGNHDPQWPRTQTGERKRSANALERGPVRPWCPSPMTSGASAANCPGDITARKRTKQNRYTQALQLMHASFGSPAFSCSIARCSAPAADSWPKSLLAPRTLSTSTVNLMASAAAFVRK